MENALPLQRVIKNMIDMQGYSKGFLYFICAVSAMGGLLFGYDWVVIGGAKPFYELYFGIADSPLMQGVAMTTALVGCLVGAMVAGAAADKYGRKPLLTVSAVLFTVSAIATGLFNDFTLFNIARFIGGIGIGVASALAPMYIAEVSPAEIRGRMVSLNQMTIVLGILGAQIVNMLLARDTAVAESQAWNVEWGWRWMFWAETVPAALFLLMSFFIPESPVYKQLKAQRLMFRSSSAGLQGKNGQLSILLDNVQDPGNLGTIIRIADWFGIDTIFCSEGTVDAWNPKVVQATMGSIARVHLIYLDTMQLLDSLPKDFPVYGTFLDGENIYTQELSQQGLIVMGNEGNGISDAVRARVTHKLLIPDFHKGPTADSLNVAIATAITCSEFRRRG